MAGEQRNLDGKLGFLSSLHGSVSHSDYKHDETKGSAVESTFKNKGWEAHIGGTHIPVSTALGQLKGAWGIQASESRLRMTSAEHPLLPNSSTSTKAFFVFEELNFAKDKAVNFGARIEDVKVSALAGNRSESDGAGTKKFKPFSSSLGYRQNLNKVWTATSNLSYTERAPTFYELFAHGEHHATGTYEEGSVNQKKEKGQTFDLALNYKTETSRARLGAFVSDFSNFIGSKYEGLVNHDGDPTLCNFSPTDCIPKYAFTGVKARLYGLEADGRFPLARGVMSQASQIDLAWKADYVRGEDRTNGTALPRIAPLRLSAAFIYIQGRYSSQFDVRHAASQNRYADQLGSTPSYTLLGMGASYRTLMPGLNSAYWFVRVDNLTNEVARNASSVMRDVTMAGSRAVRVGLRANF